MPYHLEKGPMLRLLEGYLNSDRKTMRRRLDGLRQSPSSMDWAAAGFFRSLDKKALAKSPQKTQEGLYKHLMTDWFGCQEVDGEWVRQDRPLDALYPSGPGTTGFWLAYSGNVLDIFRQAITWTLELALGLSPGETGKGRRWPHRIEMFWKCPTPWFEAWVVRRPIGIPFCQRGIITLLFLTPSSRGSDVSESPLASYPTTRPLGVTHPVPSTQPDYEVLGQPPPHNVGLAPVDRRYAMWVVTHKNHTTDGTIAITGNTTEARDFADWGIPQVSIYKGVGDVVVVSPSMAAGGVTHDGAVAT